MNFVQLRCIVEVSKTGSFTKASENLLMAQPNLSRSIIDVEKEVGDPIEIARACLFLASDEAAYVNGAELAVDGGWCAA